MHTPVLTFDKKNNWIPPMDLGFDTVELGVLYAMNAGFDIEGLGHNVAAFRDDMPGEFFRISQGGKEMKWYWSKV